jgi:predicted ester cyclase
MKTLKYTFRLLFWVILLTAFSCQDKKAQEELNKIKQAESLKVINIEAVKNFYKFIDEGKSDSIRSLIAPAFKIYYESADAITFDDIRPLITMFYTSFPDYIHEIDDILATDDKVIARLTYSGTFTNPFMEIKPTGVKFKYKGIQIFQFANNKMINFWAVEDELGLMTQLGMELQPKKK